MKDRIRQLMETQHLTQQSFASMLGVAPASLSSIFNERTKPTLNHVEAIQRAFPNINLSWLISGVGDMFQSQSPSSSPSSTSQSFFDAPVGTSGANGNSANTVGGNASVGPNPLFSNEPLIDFDTPVTDPVPVQRPAGTARHGRMQAHAVENLKIIDKSSRKISEIRVYFDDNTFELFVPKK